MSISCRLESVQKLAASAYLVRLRLDEPFVFQAGQHIKLTAAVEGYFSIASAPESPVLELIVRASGRGLLSDLLVAMSPGDLLSAEGPFGSFGLRAAVHRHALLISQGTGIAPMLSILRSRRFAESAPLSTRLLAGFREESEIIGLDSFGVPLAESDYHVTLSRPHSKWGGLRGRITDHLKRGTLSIDWLKTEFYLCGGPDFLADVKAILGAHGVAAGSIHSD